jgi:hypothetical protein
MTRFIYIALFTLFGFILTPTDTYACESKSEKVENTCSKKSDSETEKKGCCDTDKGQCGKHGKDCEGNCGNPACHCPTNCTNFSIPLFDAFLRIKIIVSKPNFYYQDTYYSSGFLTIWQPPKIG